MEKNTRAPTRPVQRLAWALPIFLLLALSSSLFADTTPIKAWQPAVMGAIGLALFIAAFAYMVVHALHLEHHKALVRDELFQVGLVAVLAGFILVGMPWVDSFTHSVTCGVSDIAVCPVSMPHAYLGPTANDLDSSDNAPYNTLNNDAYKKLDNTQYATVSPIFALCSTGVQNPTDSSDQFLYCPSTSPLSSWALDVNHNQQVVMNGVIRLMGGYSNAVGAVSSKSGFCSMVGVGFSVAGCSAYSALRGPVGQLLNAGGMALMDLKAEELLLRLAYNPANNNSMLLSLILPIGLLLRALHFSRKAGAGIIALAISFYIVFPAALIISQGAADRFILDHVQPDSTNPHAIWARIPVPNSGSLSCDPYDADHQDENGLVSTLDGILKGHNFKGEVCDDLVSCPSDADLILFAIFRTLLSTVIALALTLGAARVLGQALGTEIDVQSIARLS